MKDKFEVNIDDTINSGQVFLWKKFDSKWYGINGKKILVLGNKLDVKSKDIHNFFRFDDNFQGIKKQLSKDKVMKKAISNFSGMRVLQFDFMDFPSIDEYINYSVVCTGTHDNETAIQWYNNISNHNEKEVYEQQKHINRILNTDTIDVNWSMISFCMHSKALIVIFPIQDLLGLDAVGRMNIPGTVGDQNWTWRMESGLLDERVIKKMSNLTKETLRE